MTSRSVLISTMVFCTDALNYYYQNRSGMDIEEKYITSCNEKDTKADLAHKGGHAPTDNAYVQSKWVRSYGQEFDGDKTYQIDGVGGWDDAGDHGKYVVNGGISVWTLQNMFERAKAQGSADKFNDNGVMSIPQNYSVGNIKFDGTGSPDILDEARVELEWMFNMMVKSTILTGAASTRTSYTTSFTTTSGPVLLHSLGTIRMSGVQLVS